MNPNYILKNQEKNILKDLLFTSMLKRIFFNKFNSVHYPPPCTDDNVRLNFRITAHWLMNAYLACFST